MGMFISGSSTSTGSFGSLILKSGYPNGTNTSTLDIYSTNSFTRFHSIGYYGYIDAVLGQYLRSRDSLFLGTSDGSHMIQISWGPILAHRMNPAAGMSDFKIFAGSSGSNNMDGDNDGGAGLGFYTGGSAQYHIAFQPYFHGGGCDVIHNFESTSGVKTEGFRLNNSGNVGIGTRNPGTKTHIYTTGAGLKVEAAGTSPFTQTIAEFRYLGNGNSITVQNILGAASLNATSIMQLASGNAVRLSMDATNSTFTNNIVTSGNVSGSATSTGSFGQLQIGQQGYNAKINAVNTGGDYTTDLLYLRGGNGDRVLRVAPSGGGLRLGHVGNSTWSIDSDGYENIRFSKTSDLKFFTNNGERVTINSSGNVGIGNTSPSQKLTVQGIISGSGGLHSGGNIRLGPGGYIQGYEQNNYTYLRNYIQFGGDVKNFVASDLDSYFWYNFTNTSTPQMSLKTGRASGGELAILTVSGSIITTGANEVISGSATSTGSFGQVTSAGRSYFTKGMNVGTTYTTGASATQLILARGSQANPAIAFEYDTNTGIYQTTDNELRIGVNNNNLVKMTYYNFDVMWNLRVGLSNDTTISYDGKQISGSAISTGSFGSVFVANINNGKSLSIGDNTRGNHKIYDSQGYLRFDSNIMLGSGYIYSHGVVNIDAGTNDIRLGSSSGGPNTVHFRTDGSTDGTTITKNHITASGNFSSSLASTGSFGALTLNGSPIIKGRATGIMVSSRLGINVDEPVAPLHVENGTSGHAVIRLEDARTGDTSITAGGRLDFHSNHLGYDKRLGQIFYEQDGPNHQGVRFLIKGTLAGVGGKKLVMNDNNGRWRFYNNYTEDLALEIKDQRLAIGGIINPTNTLEVSGSIVTSGFGNITTPSTSTGSFGSVHTVGNIGVGTTDTRAKLHIKDGTDAGIILEDDGESSGVGNVRIRSEGGELKIESLNGSFATHKTILRTVSNTGLTRFVGGQDIQAQISVGGVYGVNNSDNSAGVRLGYSSTNTTFRITDTTDGSAQFTLDNTTGHAAFKGNVEPMTDNTSNLGSSTKRWANIHSADLHLSNEDTEGNEVDGTTGNWTIQEGEDDLYLLNRKNGKKYRFKLEEIT